MITVNILLVATIYLILGDFLSTFLYHVPQHAFGKLHNRAHHRPHQNFVDYAVLSSKPLVLIDGFLGALPYFLLIPWFWQISAWGTLLGLILGEFHVIWRHTSSLSHKTPQMITQLCSVLKITTPEIHWVHHLDSRLAYGDIFTFYDRPAQAWFRFLHSLVNGKNKREFDGDNYSSENKFPVSYIKSLETD